MFLIYLSVPSFETILEQAALEERVVVTVKRSINSLTTFICFFSVAAYRQKFVQISAPFDEWKTFVCTYLGEQLFEFFINYELSWD